MSDETDQDDTHTLLKKPAFLDRVLTHTDAKKRDAKPTIEAALTVLGEALIAGEDVALPPLGKLRVVRAKDLGGGAQVLTLKLRTPPNATLAGKDAVDMEPDDD